MGRVRKYQVSPEGGMGNEFVTAIDSRDVEPLVEAARFMCRATAETINARGSREAEDALRRFDAASDALATALQPFTQQEGEGS